MQLKWKREKKTTNTAIWPSPGTEKCAQNLHLTLIVLACSFFPLLVEGTWSKSWTFVVAGFIREKTLWEEILNREEKWQILKWYLIFFSKFDLNTCLSEHKTKFLFNFFKKQIYSKDRFVTSQQTLGPYPGWHPRGRPHYRQREGERRKKLSFYKFLIFSKTVIMITPRALVSFNVRVRGWPQFA